MDFFLNTLSLLLALFIVVIAIPPVVRVAYAKALFDPRNSRKIHTKAIPPLGGVALFLGFLLSSIISTKGYVFFELKYIIAGITLMFYIGLKDDLLDISARKKFMIQIVASLLLITLGDIRITNLHGIFGIYGIPSYAGILLTLFIMLSLINAYNLIDGIDGLASGLAMMASTVFGVWFFVAGHMQYSIVSFALLGSLFGFFIYNVFGNKYKLFLGDTGSLIIGLLMATLIIKFNEFNISARPPFAIGDSPAVSFAVVAIPLIDMLRVMTIRILAGQSPFAADNNHIHHRILSMVPNHLKVTLIIVSGNALFILLALFSNHLSYNRTIQFIIIFLVVLLSSFIPSRLLQAQKRRKETFAHQLD